MRIDVFLKLSGLLRTRTLAGKACDGGFVTVNERKAKPSTDVGPGDSVSLVLPGGRSILFTVESIPAGRSVPRSDRGGLFRVVSGEPPRA